MSRLSSRTWFTLPLATAILTPIVIIWNQTHQVVAKPPSEPIVTVLASGLKGGSGCTVGPGGALYVTEWEIGRISRIDPRTGRVTTFAEGLPPGFPYIPYSGAVDVAFHGSTAYVLVTLVGPDVGGSDVVGIYRVDGPHNFTVIADLGAWSVANPPGPAFEVPTGAQYAIEPYRDGFLVSDSHHNRVLRVTLDGEISEEATFGNTAPTGLTVRGNKLFVAEAGPIPHEPEDGRVIALGTKQPPVLVASGVSLLVDVKFGTGNSLYALAQGEWDGIFPGDPALPNAGSLVKVNANGTFSTVVDGLDRPTSLEFIGDTAFVITLTGDLLRIEGIRR